MHRICNGRILNSTQLRFSHKIGERDAKIVKYETFLIYLKSSNFHIDMDNLHPAITPLYTSTYQLRRLNKITMIWGGGYSRVEYQSVL